MILNNEYSIEEKEDTELKGITKYFDGDTRSTYFYDKITELYAKNFTDNYNEILKHINQFIGFRTDILYSKNVGKRLLYTNTIEKSFYAAVGVDEAVLKKIVKEANIDYTTNKYNVIPIYILMIVMVAYYYKNRQIFIDILEKKGVKFTEPYEIINLYFSLRMYSLCQRQIFKYEANTQLMEYTVNNLNDRFEIYKAKNIYEIIIRYAKSNFEAYKFYFIHGVTDFAITTYVDKLMTRYKSFFKLIYGKMDEFRKDNKMLQVEIMMNQFADGQTDMNMTSNVSSEIELTTKRIITTFVQENIIKRQLLQAACTKTDTKFQVMEGIITKIREGKDKEYLVKIFDHLIAYWLLSKKQSVKMIHSKYFINESIKAYRISNTNDFHILEVKRYLDLILNLYSEEYTKTSRKATLSNMKQCVFLYIVLFIATES